MQCQTSLSSQFSPSSAKSHPAFSSNAELCLEGDRAHCLISLNLTGCEAVNNVADMEAESTSTCGFDLCRDVGPGQRDSIDV